ncbi:sugar phosphate isomerase/epimerase family protein [Parapedobacter indicus]|uniref:Sugar phosphate isomerase/epimerase n=1 Tax=Parapedobacter indicus TaxID=1477437 RepID=A0A1I3SDM0_9SPHI|nr:sugar phosphate isomerase/epimerase family protein [Parapedobacter indicus]PPK99847.1 sugar phosphate isomerase/epimerase [Parapedobacter indicus]SFJ56825.1 Sugar phosphate isomerase/epimerase [Parapedobacter indicus]
MIKLSIAIADTHALPSAFVVFRGFDACIPKAAQLGFNGVELALKRRSEIDEHRLKQLLEEHHLAVSCISTGQVYADGGLTLTEEDIEKREEVISIFKELIDLAEKFGKLINIGRVRGQIGQRQTEEVEVIFCETVRLLCDYAAPKGVTLMLEPVNRYECDFVNSIEEGVALLKRIDRPNFKLMPDVFHMNIEDVTIADELAKYIRYISYIHLADSNRLAPGQGHTDFKKIFDRLAASQYDGWVSVEILPRPDPDTAAFQSVDFLLPLIKAYNETVFQ